MRIFSISGTFFLFASTLSASAQQWSVPPDSTHAVLPPSISGEPIRSSAVSCIDGQLMFEVGNGMAIDTTTSGGTTAVISVDGSNFATEAVDHAHGSAIIIPPAAVPALKDGRQMSVSYPTFDHQAQSTFALKGSNRALSTLEARCQLATAGRAAAPAVNASTDHPSVGAVQRLQIAIAEELTPECRSYDGKSVTFKEGAVQTVPSNNPSTPDVIFNFHHITCNGASSVTVVVGVGYCGAGPCLQRRFSYQGGRYVETGQFYR